MDTGFISKIWDLASIAITILAVDGWYFFWGSDTWLVTHMCINHDIYIHFIVSMQTLPHDHFLIITLLPLK